MRLKADVFYLFVELVQNPCSAVKLMIKVSVAYSNAGFCEHRPSSRNIQTTNGGVDTGPQAASCGVWHQGIGLRSHKSGGLWDRLDLACSTGV